ncbi:hypothetical protein [Photobacterium damselae]|uniref:hypothetical protein n=1 Tax=Photobacterium damselae TaxID=38293 RepID=UPI00109BBB5F|nr:hypothetical protein [Photobacterium damselae]
MISTNWKYGVAIIALAGITAIYLQLQHFKDKSQTLEQTNIALEQRLSSEMDKAKATIESARKQVLQLAEEREYLSQLLADREREQHEQRERLESDIKAIKKKMANVKCADVRFPDDVIKQLRQDY